MKNETNKTAAEIELETKSKILSIVDSILSQQGAVKAWGLKEHCHLIACAALAHDWSTANARAEFKILLSYNGVGGNASQFRQFLSKADGGNRIAAKDVLLEDYK